MKQFLKDVEADRVLTARMITEDVGHVGDDGAELDLKQKLRLRKLDVEK